MAVSLNTQDEDGENGQYRPMAEINITPMVDVMLVLLVIFMVAAPLMVAGVPVNLPQTAATRLSQPKKPMVVTLTPDGRYQIREEMVERGQLVGRLIALKAEEGDSVVYVRAGREAGYGEVMELLGRVGEAGYQRISLLSQPVKTVTPAPPAPAQTTGN